MSKNCEICGKFHNSGCEGYCSYHCCLVAMDNMVMNLGGTLEQAETEIRAVCECVY